MVTPAAEREAVAHLKTEHEMSERRACQLLTCCRMTVRYESVRADDTNLCDRMKTIAHERRRFGYRRIHIRECQESCARGHSDHKERITWLSRKKYWISFWLVAIRRSCLPRKVCWMI